MRLSGEFLFVILLAGVLYAADWNTYVLCSSTRCSNYASLSANAGALSASDGYRMFDRKFSRAEMTTILSDVHMTTMTHAQALVEVGRARWKVAVSSQ